jgi:thioredoxin
MTAVLQADSTTATELITAGAGITLVDFTAPWCAPCRAIAPVLEQLAEEAEDLTVVALDVDASPELASAYGVTSFPTLIFFRDGRVVHRLVGARGLASLREELHRVREARAAVAES